MPHVHLASIPAASRDDLRDALRAALREQRAGARRARVEVLEVEPAGQQMLRVRLDAARWPSTDPERGQLVWPDLDLFEAAATADVVHVDRARHTLVIRPRKGTPRAGLASLRPFDFLRGLVGFLQASEQHPALADALRRALAASEGVRAAPAPSVGSPFDRLAAQPWGVVWGPPGTGKTTTLTEWFARRSLASPERVLFVSTTHLATDTAAMRYGDVVAKLSGETTVGLRVGARASYGPYDDRQLVPMLHRDADLRRELDGLRAQLAASEDPPSEDEVKLVDDLLGMLAAPAKLVLASDARVVFATLYQALSWLDPASGDRAILERVLVADPPFDVLVVDEAGLVPRATVAALSLLARQRVTLAGDPRQLAPIQRSERMRSPSVQRFFGTSALEGSNLPAPGTPEDPRMVFLDTQHRSNERIGEVVSRYAYEGRLSTAEHVRHRLPVSERLPAAALYVLDEDREARSQPARVRGERPRDGRGWERPMSRGVVQRLFEAEPELREGEGLVLAPFVAQVRAYEKLLRELGLAGWSATSVHRQQGGEADYVLFDTVHASSTGFDEAQWRRLLNVALSRARRSVVVLANRDELAQPFLRELLPLLEPVVLRRGTLVAVAPPAVSLPTKVYPTAPAAPPSRVADAHPRASAVAPVATRSSSSSLPHTLGAQLSSRARLRRVFSEEQERIRRMRIDDGPRLVRGVAGSGKTLIAAHWALTELEHLGPDARVVFAVGNATLVKLVEQTLAAAAGEMARPYPDRRLAVLHTRDFLAEALPAGTSVLARGGDPIDGVVAALDGVKEKPRVDVLYVDEAQDLGEKALRALLGTVKPRASSSDRGQGVLPVRIFYDDAQQLYDRGRPNWLQLGLDLRGRSIVMRDGYRSTRPIGELALNVYARLSGARPAPLRELVDDQLVEEDDVDGRPVFRSLHHAVDGLPPWCRSFERFEDEAEHVADQLATVLEAQRVPPGAVKIIRMNLDAARRGVLLASLRRRAPVRELQTGEAPTEDSPHVEVVTPHAIKGFDAEIVFVVGADRFRSMERGPLPSALYSAMTRARSLLFVTATPQDGPGRAIWTAIEQSVTDLELADTG